MSALEETELLRVAANRNLDPKRKSSLGQFYTPAPICRFMASLFKEMKGEIKLLDPGCGVGSLTAAFCDEAVSRSKVSSIEVHAYDVEPIIELFLQETFESCKSVGNGVPFNGLFLKEDYILNIAGILGNDLFKEKGGYSHAILNPPYKKIATASVHRKALSSAGIQVSNLYAGFVALALMQLKAGGELVAILPRSFCNGAYYLPFRKMLFDTVALTHIHIFDSRKNAFADGDVLQENIILHCIKGATQKEVTITSSTLADFKNNRVGALEATGMEYHSAPFSELVKPADKQLFLHIPTGKKSKGIERKIGLFNHSLTELEMQVSTGPVVDFRLKGDLVMDYEPKESVPLIYPAHFNGKLNWPQVGKKANAIRVSVASKPWLWKNEGFFVITRRLTSKEEKRRIVAYLYDGSLPEEWIGFDNKLNVFHNKKNGLDELTAKGLCVFLNSTLLDQYYRSVGGHTQVNAGDLKSFGYPSTEVLQEWGEKFNFRMEQSQIDSLVEDTISQLQNLVLAHD